MLASSADHHVPRQATYIAGILAITAIAFAKLSTAFLIDRVAPQTRRAKVVLFSILGIWAVFALLAVSLECGSPQWTARELHCGHRGLMVTVILTNMITDFMLAAWIIPTVWNLALDKELRLLATILFGVRGLYVSVPTIS